MRNLSRWVQMSVLVLTIAPIAAAQQRQSAKAPTTPAAPTLRLTDRHVAAIQSLTKGKPAYDFLGLSHSSGGTQRLHVISNRAEIAWKTAKAADSNGRYTPPLNERVDVVVISCGDSDLADIFECSRVRVTRPDKVEVKPLSYSAGPNVYKNGLGGTWTVREVFATYPVLPLAGGFIVDYASFDGTQWTFEISRGDAEQKLLLKDLAVFERLQAEQESTDAKRKATIAAQVEPCVRYPNKWCWHNPDDATYNTEVIQFGSKEEAVRHAEAVLEIGK